MLISTEGFLNCQIMFKIFSVKNYIVWIYVLATGMFFSVYFSSTVLKISTGVLFVSLFLSSIIKFLNLKYNYNTFKINKRVLFFCLITLVMISIDVLNNFSFKTVTDGYITRFAYYALSLIGVPYAFYLVNGSVFFKSLFRSSVVTIIFSIALLPITLSFFSYGYSYLLIDNLLLPGSFLIFSSINKHKYLGYLLFSFGIISISIIGSRSYFLVFTYFILFYSYIHVKYKTKNKFRLLFLISLMFFILLQISSVNKIITNSPLYEKFQIESFIYVFSKSDSTLLDYEGNSRSGIVESMIGEMSFKDFIYGKGIFATYSAFVERNTIEIGWLQQVFWFGVPFVFISIYLCMKSAYLNFKSIESYKKVFGILIFIKTLDALIYGMPIFSVYSFLLFTGIMLPYTLVKKSVNLNKYHYD
jgi:hypothetical protein